MAQTGSQDDLIARIVDAIENPDDNKPISFLIGSGFTLASIPGVTQIVTSIRKSLKEEEQQDFDELLQKEPLPGGKYQAAFSFLKHRRSSKHLDRVIALSTLGAYEKRLTDGAPIPSEQYAEAEGDVDNWRLPSGVESLGRILCGLPKQSRGQLLTTNFDPLLEIAINKAGAHARPLALDNSSGSAIYVEDVWDILHLHGFWRESRTLHIVSELSAARPSLASTLRAVLRTSTLVVIGYSGWRDAVMMELENMIQSHEALDPEILWCSYENEAEFFQACSINGSLNSLKQSILDINFYTGIDSNIFFPLLENKLSTILDYGYDARKRQKSIIPMGWTPSTVTEWTLDEARSRAIDFFEGRVPTPRDGYNELIAKRDIVNTIRNNIDQNLEANKSSFSLVLAASGEGKTTALFQIMASVTRKYHQATVLAYSPSGMDQSMNLLGDLDFSNPVFLFIDDASLLVSLLQNVSKAVNDDNVRNLHIVATSRETEWQFNGGMTFRWNNYIQFQTHKLNTLTRPDAYSIITTWAEIGPEALGELSKLSTLDGMTEHFLSVAHDNGNSDKSSLFGAILSTRYGEGLVDHIRDLLMQLKDRHFSVDSGNGSMSFADVFVMISIIHDTDENLLLPRERLSSALGLEMMEMNPTVLVPLGEESPISLNRNTVATRHKAIARAAVSVATEVGVDTVPLVTRLVRGAVHDVDANLYQLDYDAAIDYCYLSRHLESIELKLAAGEASVEAAPNRLSYKSALSSVYRAQNLFTRPLELAHDAAKIFSTATDRTTGVRVSLTEWGVVEGMCGNPSGNVYLAALAIADLWGDSELSLEKAQHSVYCLGIGLDKAVASSSSFVYQKGLAAVARLHDVIVSISDQEVRKNPSTTKYNRRDLIVHAPIDDFIFRNIDDLLGAIQRASQQAKSQCGHEITQYLMGFSLQFSRMNRLLNRHKDIIQFKAY